MFRILQTEDDSTLQDIVVHVLCHIHKWVIHHTPLLQISPTEDQMAGGGKERNICDVTRKLSSVIITFHLQLNYRYKKSAIKSNKICLHLQETSRKGKFRECTVIHPPSSASLNFFDPEQRKVVKANPFQLWSLGSVEGMLLFHCPKFN